ncbi:hypothetical protein [Bathymodiolus thermophilus thioautotrophic gill symbiont]|uniref:Uncharacterized protein n=1 Tax=Bathymodiolus thermophilus thioautotrophic gill symbiont TaxID=2360 RepID=A0A8H8XBE1_9GAMM|nr:hypothetical protein [Bathymodiolus thermophilus thioautotrophic gill symbiont]CAB5494272.1 hypothetical protein THERMOS_67 [Bathymodiolus thermophilus thioautotrophic gill symbiont]
MQVKTHKQIMALQNEAQKVADKLNKEVVAIAKGVQHIQVQSGIVYQLNTKKLNLIAKKVGDDLEVTLEEGVIVFDNYFNVCSANLPCLVSLPTKDSGLYHIVANTFFTLEDGTQIVYFYGEQSIISTESSAVNTDDNQSFEDIIASNIEIIAAVTVAIVAVTAIGSGDDPTDDDNPAGDVYTMFIGDNKDTSVNSRITNNANVKISLTLANDLILASDKTLQVSADEGATWVNTTGSNKIWFTTDNAVTLVTGTDSTLITARIIDTAGNVTILPLSDNSYTLDTTQATITSVIINGKKRNDGKLFTGSGTNDDPSFVANETESILRVRDEVIVKVTMSEVVHLTTTDASNPSTYTIKVDGVDKVATYVSGSGSNTLVFSYAVEDNINTTNITSPVNALSLGTDTLTDTASNNANLTISAPNITVTDITIDNTPSVINAEATKILDSAGSIKVKSSENGTAYLIQHQVSTFVSPGFILTYKQKLDYASTLVDPNGIPYGVKIDVLADTFADLSISQLKADERYKLLFLDEAGNFVGSETTNLFIIISGNTLSHDMDNIDYGLPKYQDDAKISNFIGGTGADTITGGVGADTITGGAGADTIIGGAGADTIIGGTGADTITGGAGADTITGGAGADIFNYSAAADSTQDNADTIINFDFLGAADRLNLKDIITTDTNGSITDAASLAKYIHAEADADNSTNIKLYIKSDGISTGTVSASNADMLINFTVDATNQSSIVAAFIDNNLSEYILS